MIVCFTSIIINCSSLNPKPNNKPDGYGWVECITCKGYGYDYNTKLSKNTMTTHAAKDRQKYYDSVEFFSDDHKHQEKIDSDRDNFNPGYSGRRIKKVTCNMCNGIGWIKYR